MNRLRSNATARQEGPHQFLPLPPMEVVIISDRRVKLAVREQLLKVSRGWRAQLVSQCRCGCRQYRVTVQKLVDVIVPVELLRVPLQKPSALSFQLSDGGAS